MANFEKKTKILFTIILFLNILLRIPSLFEPLYYGDECIYLTLGQGLRKGLVFYKDIHDNKPPLLYLIAALAGGKLFWFRLFTIINNTLTAFLIFKIAKKLIKKTNYALLALTLFCLFSLLPEGRIANGEIFMIMPAVLGLYWALQAQEKKENKFWLYSGLAFSSAFLFKVPVFFDFCALILAFFVFNQKNKNWQLKNFPSTLKSLFKNKSLHFLLLAFSLPILLSIFYYFLQGAFTPYVRSALLQNFGYLSSWSGDNKGLFIRLIILLSVSLLVFKKRTTLGFEFSLLFLLSLFALFGAFLSQRPYPHYLIEISPWLSLLFSFVLEKRETKQIFFTLLLIFLGFLGIKLYRFWWYPHLPYYQNFLKFALGKISQNDYFKFFSKQTLRNYQIAKYLKAYTKENDKVFIWGDGVCIYALAERLPPGRYTVNYHIYDFNGYEETYQALLNRPPKMIVMLQPAHDKFPLLETLLDTNYFLIKEIASSKIFKKIN